MKRWNRRHKNILFVLLVLLAFLSMPLYLDYLPAAERLGIYFLEIEGIRGPFLWVPALLCRGGMEAQTCCKLYIFLVNLGGCWPRPIALPGWPGIVMLALRQACATVFPYIMCISIWWGLWGR